MPESRKGIGTRKPNRGPSAGPGNRRALIAAAREVFAADGLQAPFSSIAKRAGVGQGSLYRHFPDRLSIAVAVFDENIDELEASVDRPEATLDDLFDAIIEQAAVSTALIDLIWENRHDARVAHFTQRLARLAESLLDREIASGRVGDHVHTSDVLLVVTMLADLTARTDAADRRTDARRARALIDLAFEPRSGAAGEE
ncbi:TetR/AcrR family transcriptional regulator [Agromyces agglutinans]|uniref:TetR/AcrR family transcriptional regulator n=1 Tax=Agromyces agglutinans TaxID=2662258 RepID=UPI0028A69835|nr:helix-turn-helix domain-containing protein [Agromyces agglutinans]